jgi:hypothetical protein
VREWGTYSGKPSVFTKAYRRRRKKAVDNSGIGDMTEK